jgi:hypothetical protein
MKRYEYVAVAIMIIVLVCLFAYGFIVMWLL